MVNIELGHKYTSDYNSKFNVEKYSKIIESLNLDSYEKVCLIDDYNKPLNLDLKQYISELESFNVNVFFESNFVNCDYLFEDLKEFLVTESFLKDNKKVTFFLKDSTKIPLKTNLSGRNVLHCPILTMSWYIHRLNIKNVTELHNILDKKFIKVERNVSTLLKNSSYKSFLDRINYSFY